MESRLGIGRPGGGLIAALLRMRLSFRIRLSFASRRETLSDRSARLICRVALWVAVGDVGHKISTQGILLTERVAILLMCIVDKVYGFEGAAVEVSTNGSESLFAVAF